MACVCITYSHKEKKMRPEEKNKSTDNRKDKNRIRKNTQDVGQL